MKRTILYIIIIGLLSYLLFKQLGRVMSSYTDQRTNQINIILKDNNNDTDK